MSSAWMKIIDLNNKETYGDHLWIPFRWTGDQTFIHDRYIYVHFAIFFYSKIYHSYMIGIVWSLVSCLLRVVFASWSHRWEVYYIQGRYGQVLKHHYMVIPTTSEGTTGGRPSVNTVGTIRCWKWMLNHIKDIYRELAFASCGHRCLEWILWVLHRHCDQDRLCGCNMSLIWFLQMDIYGCADFRQGFWE